MEGGEGATVRHTQARIQTRTRHTTRATTPRTDDVVVWVELHGDGVAVRLLRVTLRDGWRDVRRWLEDNECEALVG